MLAAHIKAACGVIYNNKHTYFNFGVLGFWGNVDELFANWLANNLHHLTDMSAVLLD